MSTADTSRAAAISTVQEVRALFGDLDDITVAKIVATGASPAEVAEAHAWFYADDQLGRERHHPPTGRVAAIIELARPEIEGPDEPGRALSPPPQS